MAVKNYKDVAIIGAGLVGLTYAFVLAKNGAKVTVYDIDDTKIKKLSSRVIPMYEASFRGFKIPWDNLMFTSDLNMLHDKRILIIAIGTYMNGVYTDKNLLAFFNVINPENKVFIIKSTVKPGTTRKIKVILESRGANYGKDFYLIYNPEFLREGNAVYDVLAPSKIVAGINHDDEKGIIEDVFSFVPKNIPRFFTNWETAEFIKLSQNAFLAMKISFANVLLYIAKKHKLPIDFATLAEAIGSDPRIGRYGLYPGIGFGGPCLPKDTKLLAELERDTGYRLIQEVIRINNENTARILEMLENKYGELKNKKILVVGLSFKEGTDDLRDSKALELAVRLREKGNDVYWYDDDIKNKVEIDGINPGKLDEKYDLVLITKKKHLINGIPLRADLGDISETFL